MDQSGDLLRQNAMEPSGITMKVAIELNDFKAIVADALERSNTFSGLITYGFVREEYDRGIFFRQVSVAIDPFDLGIEASSR